MYFVEKIEGFNRPESITVYLYAKTDDTEKELITSKDLTVKDADADDENIWNFEFTDLPKYSEGKLITYSVEENDIDNYEASVSGYIITNTVKQENKFNPVTIKIKKIDANGDGSVGLSGAEFTLNKDSDGSKTYTTDSNGEFEVEFKNEGTFTLQETKAPSNYVLDSSPTVYTFEISKELKNTTYDAENKQYVNEYNLKVSCVNSDYSGSTLTVKNNPEVMDLVVNKKWDDADYYEKNGYTRPDVTLEIYGEIEGSTKYLYTSVNLTSTNKKADDTSIWTTKLENVPKYKDGKLVKYTVNETDIDGFGKTIVDDTYTVENKPIKGADNLEPVKLTILKIDDNNKNKAPLANASFELYDSDGKLVDTYTTNNDGKAEIEFKKEGTYSLKESVAPTGYILDDSTTYSIEVKKEFNSISYNTVTEKYDFNYDLTIDCEATNYSDETLTVSNVPVLTDVSYEVIWDDNNNQDGVRPPSVDVRLYKTVGTTTSTVETKTVTDVLTYTFEDLPTYEDGKPVTYTIKELTEDGADVSDTLNDDYSTAYDTTTKENTTIITNIHTPETTDITIKKVWADSNVSDMTSYSRPTVSATIYGQTENITKYKVKDITISGDLTTDTWTHEEKGLPKKNSGEDITYTVEEVSVNGYSTTYSDGTLTITNTPISEDTFNSVELTINKIDSKALGSLEGAKFEVYDSTPTKIKEVTTDSKGEATIEFTTPGTYTISETSAPTGYNKDTTAYTVVIESTLNNISFADNKFTLNYDLSIKGNSDKKLEVKNDPELIDISTVVKWVDNDDADGVRPDKIKVQLYADDEPLGNPVSLSTNNENPYTYEDLPKYINGNEVVYTIYELDESSNKVVNKLNDDYPRVTYDTTTTKNTTIITNYHNSDVIDITVNKIWDDNNNQDGKRPINIKVQLYADGKEYETPVDIGVNNSWSYTYYSLPLRSSGKEIVYTVAEVSDVEGYEVSYSNDTFTITNKHTPETTDLSYEVIWDDNDNQDGKRPESVDVILYKQVGEEISIVEKRTVTDKLEDEFNGLPVYEDGKKITYIIKELDSDGVVVVDVLNEDYTTTYDCEDTKTIIINHHIPETINLVITKIWDDKMNCHEVRPLFVYINIYKVVDGEKSTLKENELISLDNNYLDDNTWMYVLNDLPVYEDGKSISYIVEELNEAGETINGRYNKYYKSSIKTIDEYTFNIINEYSPIPVPYIAPKTGIN